MSTVKKTNEVIQQDRTHVSALLIDLAKMILPIAIVIALYAIFF